MARGERELLSALIVAGPLALTAALVLGEAEPAPRLARAGQRPLASPASAPERVAPAGAAPAAIPTASPSSTAAAPAIEAAAPAIEAAAPAIEAAAVAAPAPEQPDEGALRAALERCADERQRQRLVEQLRRLRFSASPLALAARDPIDLGALSDARAAACLPEQAQLLLDPSRPYAVREAAGRALEGVATADASALLEDVAWRGDETARALAAAALRGRPEGGAALARLRNDPSLAVRAAAESAIAARPVTSGGPLPP